MTISPVTESTAGEVAVEPRRLDRLDTLMGVRGLPNSGDVSLVQEVGPRFLDHRGQSILASVGVLADSTSARAVFTAVPSGNQFVLAQITAAMAAPMPTFGAVRAYGNVTHFDADAGIGLASGEMRDADGNVLITLLVRAMTVTRPPVIDLAEFVHGDPLPVPIPEPVADPGELAGRTGVDIVADIAAEQLPRGPLAGLLDLQLHETAPGRVTGHVEPLDWMANVFGSVQGGVLISIADTITGLAAQTLTTVDQEYRVLDLKVDYLRSPATGGPAIRAEAEVIRAGRRLALIESRLVDADGKVYVRGSSSVQLSPVN